MSVISEAAAKSIRELGRDLEDAKRDVGRLEGRVDALRSLIKQGLWRVSDAMHNGADALPAGDVCELLQMLWDVSSGFRAPKLVEAGEGGDGNAVHP